MKKYRLEKITPEILFALPYDELSPEEVKEIFTFADANFTPQQLKRFSELLEQGVSADELLAELEETQKQFDSAIP